MLKVPARTAFGTKAPFNVVSTSLLTQHPRGQCANPIGYLLDESITREEAMVHFLRQSWQVKRKSTLLAYRCVPQLLPEDHRAMRIREMALIKDLSDHLHQRLRLKDEDQRLDIVANLLVFLSIFGPMRDWLHCDMPEDVIVPTVAAGACAMIRDLMIQTET